MTPRGWLILVLIVIALVFVLRALYRSPASPSMRTADQRQIERETAEIQGDAWWKRALEAVAWVVACLLAAALVVPK